MSTRWCPPSTFFLMTQIYLAFHLWGLQLYLGIVLGEVSVVSRDSAMGQYIGDLVVASKYNLCFKLLTIFDPKKNLISSFWTQSLNHFDIPSAFRTLAIVWPFQRHLFWNSGLFSLLVRRMIFHFDKSSWHWEEFLLEFPKLSGVWEFGVLKWIHDRFQENCKDQDLNWFLFRFLQPILLAHHLNTIIIFRFSKVLV